MFYKFDFLGLLEAKLFVDIFHGITAYIFSRVTDTEQQETAPLSSFDVVRMVMLEFAFCFAACSAIAAASWDGNIN